MSYQDRKDIDELYNLVWDTDSNQYRLVEKAEYEEFKKQIINEYYEKIETDTRYAPIEHSHNMPPMMEVDGFTKNDVTVTVYSDGSYVTVVIDGTIAMNISGHTTLDDGNTTIDSTYRPFIDTYTPIHSGSTAYKLIIGSDGVIDVLHNSVGDTVIECQVTYPLKSRISSS